MVAFQEETARWLSSAEAELGLVNHPNPGLADLANGGPTPLSLTYS